jgi:hypothetical protein
MSTDPLEPGHIPGQNPNTPERLQGGMEVSSGRVSNSTARAIAIIAIPLAVIIAVILIYGSMLIDPGARPEGSPTQESSR